MAKFILTITFISLILIFFSSLTETQSKIRQINDQKNKIINLTNFILKEKGVINGIDIIKREDGQRIVLSTKDIKVRRYILFIFEKIKILIVLNKFLERRSDFKNILHYDAFSSKSRS